MRLLGTNRRRDEKTVSDEATTENPGIGDAHQESVREDFEFWKTEYTTVSTQFTTLLGGCSSKGLSCTSASWYWGSNSPWIRRRRRC